MNNYNKIQKANIDINTYLKRIDKLNDNNKFIHSEEIKTFLNELLETLEGKNE